jgi:hypothetical protein
MLAADHPSHRRKGSTRMDSEEARNEYSQLVTMLGAVGLQGLVRHTENYIRQGKTEQTEIERLEEEPTFFALEEPQSLKRRRRTKANYQTTKEYTEQEKLEILIDAVLQDIVHSRQMEIALWPLLDRRQSSTGDLIGVTGVIIVRPGEELEESVVRLRQDLPYQALEKLRRALDQLREEVVK